jgi:hypothetical protein
MSLERLCLSPFAQQISITFGAGRRGLVKIADKLPGLKLRTLSDEVKCVIAVPTISYAWFLKAWDAIYYWGGVVKVSRTL